MPARRVEVADTIGAGDAFMAGLLAGLLTPARFPAGPGRARGAAAQIG
ncbi:PfkB family carbohydrate kinase [Kitasatospora indigofera]